MRNEPAPLHRENVNILRLLRPFKKNPGLKYLIFFSNNLLHLRPFTQEAQEAQEAQVPPGTPSNAIEQAPPAASKATRRAHANATPSSRSLRAASHHAEGHREAFRRHPVRDLTAPEAGTRTARQGSRAARRARRARTVAASADVHDVRDLVRLRRFRSLLKTSRPGRLLLTPGRNIARARNGQDLSPHPTRRPSEDPTGAPLSPTTRTHRHERGASRTSIRRASRGRVSVCAMRTRGLIGVDPHPRQ